MIYNTTTESDQVFMLRAIELARAQLGKTAPNPPVGCVIVLDGEIIAEAATGNGGRPHAEETALALLAGRDLSFATAYVTLEPCHSRSNGSGGCSDHILASGIKRVIVAELDTHPTADGGVSKLRDAQVEVHVGLCQDLAHELTAGFFKRVVTGMPLVCVSEDSSKFDADFIIQDNETFADALMRMGKSGLTRVRVAPDSELAALMKAQNVLD